MRNTAPSRADLYAHFYKYVPNMLVFLNKHHRGIDDARGCWIWRGAPTAQGRFGRASIGPRDDILIIYAHRLSFMIYVGDPGDQHVLHRCGRSLCFNPEHLFLGDAGIKVRATVARGRHRNQNTGIAHCRHGHPLTGNNVRLEAGRFRRCLACQRQRRRPRR
jgi:hypothetical protein